MLFLAFSVNAQQGGQGRPQGQSQRERPTPEQMAKNMVERMNKELNLTEKQQKDFTTYFTESAKKQQEMFEKNKSNREAMVENMKKNREETDAYLKKNLTADQYKKYQENQAKRMQERQNRNGEHPGRGQGR